MDELTDWVKVKRRNKQGRSHEESEDRDRKGHRVVQIFVKTDGSKTTPMGVDLTDRVGDIVKRIVNSESHHENAVHQMGEGRVLRRSEELKSSGFRDGCKVYVVRRMRGGGKHKDKRKDKVEKKQVESQTDSGRLQEQMERRRTQKSRIQRTGSASSTSWRKPKGIER